MTGVTGYHTKKGSDFEMRSLDDGTFLVTGPHHRSIQPSFEEAKAAAAKGEEYQYVMNARSERYMKHGLTGMDLLAYRLEYWRNKHKSPKGYWKRQIDLRDAGKPYDHHPRGSVKCHPREAEFVCRCGKFSIKKNGHAPIAPCTGCESCGTVPDSNPSKARKAVAHRRKGKRSWCMHCLHHYGRVGWSSISGEMQ